MDNDTVLIFGEPVKALGDGRFGGYLVRFTSAADPDLTGEYFTRETDFGDVGKATVYFNHGLDPVIKRRKLGTADLRIDDAGIWAETILQERDDYERAIAELARAGKLGWSSGTAKHLVEYERGEKSTRIASWPLGLDASLTHTPAEPRNAVIPLKSFDPPTVDGPAIIQPVIDKEINMSDEIKQAVAEAVAEALAARDEATKAAAKLEAEKKALFDEGYKAAQEEMRNVKRAAPAIKKVTDVGFSDDEVKSFLWWVKTGDDAPYKAAMQGQTDSEGGYAVPDGFYNTIVEKRNLSSWVRQAPTTVIQTDLDRVLIPAEGTAATKFVVTAEEAAYDENEPTLAQVAVTVHKLTKVIKVSEELMADNKANLSGFLASAFGRGLAQAENYYFTVGSGSGEPQGVVTGATASTAFAGATAITATEIVATPGLIGGAYNVPSECGFLMKNSMKWYLRGLAVTNQFAFVPTPQGGEFVGYPAYISDDMAAMTTGLKSILFGNLNYYCVVERAGLTVSRNPYLYEATGQIGIFAKIRLGGAVLQSEAIITRAQA